MQHTVQFVKYLLLTYIELGIEDAEYVTADINAQRSLNQMCMRSTMIIDCVGPVSGYRCKNNLLPCMGKFCSVKILVNHHNGI